MSSYVICPETITGPEAKLEYPWMPNNAPCACKCKVVTPAPIMDFRCPRGHRFIAEKKDILHD